MKKRQFRRPTANVSHSRWLAYATACAATALVGINSAEATIHYSGDLHEQFGPNKVKTKTFPLDQVGDHLVFARGTDLCNDYSHLAAFSVVGIASAYFKGSDPFSIYQYPVYRVSKGANISSGHYIHPYFARFGCAKGALASDYLEAGKWEDPGIGFVGFKFNSGAGVQYGWVRVRMSKLPENAFTVLDYAYADPGEPISAGQRSSDERAPEQGSLGWLAAGGVGLLAWRKSRSRALDRPNIGPHQCR